MNAAQINSQLTPRGGVGAVKPVGSPEPGPPTRPRCHMECDTDPYGQIVCKYVDCEGLGSTPGRERRAGVGASFVTLQPGDSFMMTLDISQGGNPSAAIPANLNASGFGGNFTGKYTGTTPYQLFPGQFSYVQAVNYGTPQNPNWQNITYTYKVLSASSTSPPPSCPPGYYWNGNTNACEKQIVLGPTPTNTPVTTFPHAGGGLLTGGSGGTTGGSSGTTGGSSGTKGGSGAPAASSSKTTYYVAGGAVLALAAGAAYWKYGRKGSRR